MGYKNKTYVIFDGDDDMWAYAFMKGWKANDRVEFNFFDAHDLRPLSDRASEATVKASLSERLASTSQAIVLVGENTKNLFRFVRWELESCLKRDIPLIAVNLNNKRRCDDNLCPAIIREEYVSHVSFKMKIIQYALDNFPNEYSKRSPGQRGARYYEDSIYANLGL